MGVDSERAVPDWGIAEQKLAANDDAAQIFFRRFGSRRGAWVEISFSQSFRSQPTRPLLRLRAADGRVAEQILPAAVFGRAAWIGLVPIEFVEMEILIHDGAADDFRIDRMSDFGLVELQWRLWLRAPRQVVRFWTRDLPRSRKQQANPIRVLPDRYPLSAIAKFARKRGRAIELDKLDRIVPSDRVVEFLMLLSDRFVAAELAATVASLRGQAWTGWRMTIAAPAGLAAAVAAAIVGAGPLAADERIAIVEFSESELSGTALVRLIERATGDMIGFLDNGDRLTAEAILAIHAHIAGEAIPAALYTDSALVDAGGRITEIRLKPDWSPEYLRRDDYVGGLWLLNADVARTIAPTLSGNFDTLRRRLLFSVCAAGSPEGVRHIKRVLLHRLNHHAAAAHGQNMRPAMPALPTAAKMAVAGEALEKMPKVSIIIPTRDRLDLLQRAVDTLLEKTVYENYEVIIVDNGSTEEAVTAYLARLQAKGLVQVISHHGTFNFPRLMNGAVAHASGDIIVMLNNDTFIIEPNWLSEMVALAIEPGVGAVGAKLIYPNGTIQHAGVVVGLGGYAGHYYRRLEANHRDHLGRLAVTHEVSAVTAACLAVTRANYDAVGGLDEALAIDFNDIDFCLRLTRRGLRNLWTPDAVVGHVESASRVGPKGKNSPLFLADGARFAQRWKSVMLNDPYFHPALSLQVFHEMLE